MFQWFPGHMTKALRLITEQASLADLFIVVLDARAPISTYNAELARIAPHKPRLFVITKADYADHLKMPQMVKHFTAPNQAVVVVNLQSKSARPVLIKALNNLLSLARARAIERGILHMRERLFVVGVPNAGKSTLINVLAKAQRTLVANRPGVTRGPQWVNVDQMQLLDTPGVLWPKFADELTGVKLAVIGSIRWDIIPPQTLYYAGYRLLNLYYPQFLKTIGLVPSDSEALMQEALLLICQKRGFLLSGSEPDLRRAMSWFATYLRDLKGVTYD